jgi:hypothetical protein
MHWVSHGKRLGICLVLALRGGFLVGSLAIILPASAAPHLRAASPALFQQVQGGDAAEPWVTSPSSRQEQPGRVEAHDPYRREHLLQLATDDPRAVFELARTWPQDRGSFPEEILKHAVQTAWQRDASWHDAEAAIRAFDLYHDRPWLPDVLAPFVSAYATTILLNITWFITTHPGWTRTAMAMVVQQLPGQVLRDLDTLVAIDSHWATGLAETAATMDPPAVLASADRLLAVDPIWAQGLIQQAAASHPRDVIRSIEKLAAPWGQQLFDQAALDAPYVAVGMASVRFDIHQAVRTALQRSTVPSVQMLARIAESSYPEPIKGRMVAFMWRLSDARLTLTDTARLSTNDGEFFRALVAMKLDNHPREVGVVETMLSDTALELTERLNALHDEPDTKRFHTIASFTAQALYLLIAYGESVMYTSSYRGLFARLLTMMRRDKMTGAQLLASVHEVRFRAFIKAAATFNRLDAFLATMPSAVARWALLARCVQDIERSPDIAVQAVTAAGILSTLQDPHSLRLLRDIITHEYRRALHETNREGLIVYGLLAAHLAGRLEPELLDHEIQTIGGYFGSYMPDLTVLPLAKLFTNGVNIQRYFFYDDEDGEASFQSFVQQYRHTTSWHIEDHETFVHIFSDAIHERRIDIYANKPASTPYASALDQALRQRGIPPHMIVHRGHSYHAAETLDQISATAAIVFLGNCGSYSELDAVLAKAPEAHIISTQGIGSHTVNDPLLKALNDYLLRGPDLRWAEFWHHAASLLRSNPRFADYIPPDQNTGALFLKAYRSLTTPQHLAAYPGVMPHELLAGPLQARPGSARATPLTSWVRLCHAVPQ